MSNHYHVEKTNNIAIYWIVLLSAFVTGIVFMAIFFPNHAFGETNNTEIIMQQFYNGVYSDQMEGYIIYIKAFGGL